LTHHQEPVVSGTNRVKRHGGKAMRVLQTKIVYLHSSFFLVIAKAFFLFPPLRKKINRAKPQRRKVCRGGCGTANSREKNKSSRPLLRTGQEFLCVSAPLREKK
jgi:hypothetical protein